jgi:asparagine synthase (glutamine-hydrolysing)
VHQGNRWIAMDGAIYNQEELRQRLDPPLPPTAGPEEIVLRLYAEEGPDGLVHLEGVFAVAVIDGDDLFLARDPLGVRPLYYGQENGTFYFASEIKALQAATRDVHVFPPGHWYRSGQGFQPYYDLRQAVPEHGCATDAEWNLGRLERKVRQKLATAVARRLEPGVPTGVFLSGGLDSSVVAAVVKDQMEEVATFCVGMAGSEDLAFARQVAQHLGTQHHERKLQPAELLAVLPEVIYHLESFDAPLVRSAVGHYLAAREAQGQVRLMFTGEGADELFAGYKHLQRRNNTPAGKNAAPGERTGSLSPERNDRAGRDPNVGNSFTNLPESRKGVSSRRCSGPVPAE